VERVEGNAGGASESSSLPFCAHALCRALKGGAHVKHDPVYKRLAQLVDARLRCMADDKPLVRKDWGKKHEDRILALVKEHMPSGSGFDNGTKIDLDRSSGERLVFDTAFHHMDEHGGYAGWTEHTVTVTPSLAFGTRIKIGGKNRNDIKEHMHECFSTALDTVETEAQGVPCSSCGKATKIIEVGSSMCPDHP